MNQRDDLLKIKHDAELANAFFDRHGTQHPIFAQVTALLREASANLVVMADVALGAHDRPKSTTKRAA